MYINVKNFRATEVFGGESVYRYSVESKDKGHIEYINFITDADGVGSLEWCKGSTATGYGEKISLEDLFDLLEKRHSQ
jgi:hypothetical protein